jgi:hypothetical protein
MDKNIDVSGGSSQNLDTRGYDNFTITQEQISAIRVISAQVISSREELEQFLKKHDIKLLTSFSDLIETRSFIQSSYIIYIMNNMTMEKLVTFLERNPNFQKIVDKIEQELVFED